MLLQPLRGDNRVLNVMLMFIWSVFIFYTISFGFNFLVISKKQGDYVVGQKVCHKLFDTPDGNRVMTRARLDDLAGEVNVLKENVAQNLTGK